METLLQIQITDYHYRDTIEKGTTPQKKVIAQQVAEVYPQAVDKTVTEVVPDIMKMAVLENGFVLLENHGLENGEKVQLLFAKGGPQIFEVKNVTVNSFEITTEKSGEIFVYGREVDDFHVVDYEAIAMLNVSATQEMFKVFKAQSLMIQEVQTELKELKAFLEAQSSNQETSNQCH